jgi:hypothetical protein
VVRCYEGANGIGSALIEIPLAAMPAASAIS